MYVPHAGGQAAQILFYGPWDWEIYNVIWTAHSDYCAVITFHFIWKWLWVFLANASQVPQAGS